jgi:hypothetical protein
VIPVRAMMGQHLARQRRLHRGAAQQLHRALKDLPEVWEIGYGDGLFHAPEFPCDASVLDDYLDDFFFDPEYRHLMGAARNARNGQVVNLDAGRKVADLDLDGMPHLGSGITFEYQGRPVLATPHLRRAR